MGRNENVLVFEDTRSWYKTDPELMEAINSSNRQQQLILETDAVAKGTQRYAEPAQIIVSRKRSFEAAQAYPEYKTCVLNFASATNPGGGVVWGSTAQEECLCRCSTLYANLTDYPLWTPFYEAHRQQHNPLYNDDCIYTPDVVVFKTDTLNPVPMKREDWWKVNIITCAAPNLRPDRDGRYNFYVDDTKLHQIHVKRMRRILSVAAANGNEAVILGAYGCGAFRNPPGVVAAALKQVADEFKHHFRVIEFAVYCSPRDELNYKTFRRVFSIVKG